MTVSITCDRCGCAAARPEPTGNDVTPAHVLRAHAEITGWRVGVRRPHRRELGGRLDFCPPCVSEINSPGAIHATGPVWDFFGLSYSSYLVVQRAVLQAMPIAWQQRFCELMREVAAAIALEELPGSFWVRARQGRRFVSDPWSNYRRPPAVPMRGDRRAG
jgi:hypothetical protein